MTREDFEDQQEGVRERQNIRTREYEQAKEFRRGLTRISMQAPEIIKLLKLRIEYCDTRYQHSDEVKRELTQILSMVTETIR